MKSPIPTGNEIIREAVIVVAGAVLAAFVVSRFPALKKWIDRQWSTGGN